MRITCPLCGPRDRREFYYYGSDDYLNRVTVEDGIDALDNSLFLRDNPAGVTRGIMKRAAPSGCGSRATRSRMRFWGPNWSPT